MFRATTRLAPTTASTALRVKRAKTLAATPAPTLQVSESMSFSFNSVCANASHDSQSPWIMCTWPRTIWDAPSSACSRGRANRMAATAPAGASSAPIRVVTPSGLTWAVRPEPIRNRWLKSNLAVYGAAGTHNTRLQQLVQVLCTCSAMPGATAIQAGRMDSGYVGTSERLFV